MKLFEISNTLEMTEVSIIMNESISDELKVMVNRNVNTPFLQFRNTVVKTFSKKLYGWALAMLHDLQKGADFDSSKHYVKTLEKIINNPEGVTSQIVANIISQHSAKGSSQKPDAPLANLSLDQI